MKHPISLAKWRTSRRIRLAALSAAIFIAAGCPINVFSANFTNIDILPDSIAIDSPVANGDDGERAFVVVDTIDLAGANPVVAPIDSAIVVERIFNPDPTRAVWLSALFPGLGQIYNRRYWKLPVVVGAFMGLGYGTSWNNSMLRDYTQAYNDLLDNDPTTRSYMDFFPSTTREEDLDRTWLTSTLKRRKDYFRRNRDLCIICMIGVYLVAMVDAYVDASLAHFDISPQLSMDMAPALIADRRSPLPGIGLQCALTF